MRKFLSLVAADLHRRFPGELGDLLIIFNNKRPATYLRHELAKLSNRPFWSPEITTIQEAFSKSAEYTVASPLKQFFTLFNCFNQLKRSQGKEPAVVDIFYPIAETILSDFAQLDYELANPDHVYLELYEMDVFRQQFPDFSPEQLHYLEKFWHSFSANRQEAIQQRFIELWADLPKLYRNFHESLESDGLTTQAHIYRKLALDATNGREYFAPFKKIIFVGFNALNRAEATLFMRWQEQDKALFYFDGDRYYTDDPLQEAGYFLRQNTLKHKLKNALGDFEDLFAARTEAMTLHPCLGYTVQVKRLNQLLREARHPFNDCLLLVADEALLVPLIQSLPADMRVNITMGFPLAQSALYGLIDLWIQTKEQQFREETFSSSLIDKVFSHPLFGAEEAVKLKVRDIATGNSSVPIDASLTTLLRDTAIPDFFAPVKSARQLGRQLIALLHSLQKYRQGRQLLSKLESALIRELVQHVQTFTDSIPPEGDIEVILALNLLRRHLSKLSAAIAGEPLEGIQIMGFLESRSLNFSHVYILGANEGVLPKLSASASFIPESIRRAHGLPVLENQDALSAYLFYRTIQRAEEVHVLYNTLVTEQSTGEPSRFLRQLQFESRLSIRTILQRQSVLAPDMVPPLEVPKKGLVWDKLKAYFANGEGASSRISATAFTTYLQSPLLFFLKYIARIKEPERPADEIELNRLGSVFHQVLQWFYEALTEEHAEVSTSQIKFTKSRIAEFSRKALSMELYQDTNKLSDPNAIQQIMLKIVGDFAELVLEHDERISPFEIVELENNKSYVHPFPIQVAGETRTVLLYGIIDRIDKHAGKYRIVDYKTGADELRIGKIDDLFNTGHPEGNKAFFQTLFYTYVYESCTPGQSVEPHLYSVRKLREEGSLFYSGSGNRKQFIRDEELTQIKVRFSEFLKDILEELFNPDIPFKHREGIALYRDNPYKEFFSGYRPGDPAF